MNNVHIIATYDSFISSAFSFAQKLDYKKLDIFVLIVRDNFLSDNQKHRIGLIHYLRDLTEYFELYYHQNQDIIIVSCGNMQTIRFFKFFCHFVENQQNRPVIITLFAGYIAGDKSSILIRCLSDILLLNNRYDYEIAEILKNKYDLKCKNLIYGYSNTLRLEHENKAEKIYFIDQVKIPETKKNRQYVLNSLIVLATKYPNEKFVILSRVTNDEKTVHVDKYPYVELMSKQNIPDNLTISNISVKDALQDMKYCLTISSTVFFNALYNDISVGLIVDLGINKKNANALFKNSGLLTKFSDFDPNKKLVVNIQWKEQFLDQYINIKEVKNVISHIELKPIDLATIKMVYKKIRPFYVRFIAKCKKLLFHPLLFLKDMQ